MTHTERRVVFDFEIEFTNGGGIKGQDFRLDIAGDDIDDRTLADYLVADMRLLMVGAVRILNKRIIAEPHKRRPIDASGGPVRLIDLSHTIEDGMRTYKGLPAPIICDYLSREASYRNPLPVAVVLVPVDDGLLVVRRSIPPRSGLLALPGGFINHGEGWQEAGAREVEEETGLRIEPATIREFAVRSAPDGTLLVFGMAAPLRAADLPRSSRPSRRVSGW